MNLEFDVKFPGDLGRGRRYFSAVLTSLQETISRVHLHALHHYHAEIIVIWLRVHLTFVEWYCDVWERLDQPHLGAWRALSPRSGVRTSHQHASFARV
jgi:hypothetical protein